MGREFGSRDKRASCRKMDQYIYYADGFEFVNRLSSSWDFGETRFDEVTNWEFPVMALTHGLKIHRMDMTLCCIQHFLNKRTSWTETVKKGVVKRFQICLKD